MKPLTPMEAVAALYADGHDGTAETIVASLGRAVFGDSGITPAGPAQRLMARASHRLMQWTTTRRQAGEEATFRNALLERSGHPYARSLLASSGQETESLVEGGDPMNGPYMMIAPEIRQAGTRWDRLFFNSVQGRDVQLRFIWETRATYDAARQALGQGRPVRLKALAAGTGLSMILAYDKLMREGCDAGLITVNITDRDPANTAKTKRLLGKLASTQGTATEAESEGGISAQTEDIFEAGGGTGVATYDVVTAVGILEYLQGFACLTTEQRLDLPQVREEATALHLAERLGKITTESASLIVNTYRPHASTRILEVFGKRFDYRHRADLSALLATAHFRPSRLVGSGTIYDVEVHEKFSPGS